MLSSGDSDSTMELAAEPDEPEGRSLSRGQSLGRYVVIDEVASGGMGQIFVAYDPELDRRVAIKLLRTNVTTPRGRERLLREAQALAQLAHPNVVAVYDAGTFGDDVFVAMEFIEGQTLRKWIRGHPDASWQDALALLLDAGRGLAAAHEVGIVHRDFKPANVMVGDDGRVRVLDFGLARRTEDRSQSIAGDDPSMSRDRSMLRAELSAELTEAGVVMGTPRYMAPEQFYGGKVDARTDQFAFCIVAYRVLFGVAPFSGSTFETLATNVSQGRLSPPESGRTVPRRIRQAVLRGLATDRDARFESMDALLRQLALPRGGRRRLAGAIAIASIGTAATAWLVTRDTAAAPCAGVEAVLDETWSSERAASIAEALAAPDLAFASDTSERVVDHVEAYATRWRAGRRAACEATRLRGDQSANLMDLRISCLEQRRRELGALLAVFESADASVVEHAVDAVDALRPVDHCANPDVLLAAVEPPTDPEVARAVEEIRGELSHARALELAGKTSEALEIGRSQHERAGALDYPPILAEASVALGSLLVVAGNTAAAIAPFDEALFAAVASGDDTAEVDALLGLAAATPDEDPERALHHARHARAAIAHLGDPPDELAKAWMYAATAHTRQRDWEHAEAAYRRAIEIAADRPSASRIRISGLSNLGMLLGMRGNADASIEALGRARALATERLGPLHPSAIRISINLSGALAVAGRHEELLGELDALRPLAVQTFGERHTDIARIDHNASASLLALGRYEESLAVARRALEIKEATLGPEHPGTANTVNNIGDALANLGRAADAVDSYQEALRRWGPSPERLYALIGLADAHLAQGKTAEALQAARDGLALLEDHSASPAERGQLHFVAARALWATGGDQAQAHTHAQLARKAFGEDEGDAAAEALVVERWIQQHPVP